MWRGDQSGHSVTSLAKSNCEQIRLSNVLSAISNQMNPNPARHSHIFPTNRVSNGQIYAQLNSIKNNIPKTVPKTVYCYPNACVLLYGWAKKLTLSVLYFDSK